MSTSLPARTLSELESILRETLGNDFHIQQTHPVSGGDSHHAFCIQGSSAKLFAKLDSAQNQARFAAEAQGLQALSACTAFQIPTVIAQTRIDTHSFLIMEWLDLHPLSTTQQAEQAGQALAQLHHLNHEQYGWHQDNFIGATPQINNWHHNWPHFFTQYRLKPQLELAAQHGFHGELQRDGERILNTAAALFLDYRPLPSLLHGDLWNGNIGTLSNGRPALFDPACYYGDQETDLAMTELFGGFPLPFYAAYRHAWPLNEGYERRKPLYNLYHILNHLNLFGRGYLNQAERMARNLSHTLR